MSDDEFIESFENCTLPKEDFHHRDHVRLAWLYLRRHTVLEALSKFCEGLKRFASAHGKAGLYHETISWAYVLLIRERIERAQTEATWEEFADGNPDLLDWRNNILKSYYYEETLKSDLAKRVFVLPDRDARGK